jgi:hypothetical protein
LPLRAGPSVTAFDDIAWMKDQPSRLSRALRGMDMDQNSTAVAIRVPPGAVVLTGNSTACIFPGQRDWSGRLGCAWRAKGRMSKAARPWAGQVTWSSLVMVA